MKTKSSNIIKGKITEHENLRTFLDGSTRSYVLLRSCAVGLGKYKPGWKWSTHAGVQTGKPSENHIGYIISGHMMIKDSNGVEIEIGPGEAFEVVPGSDAWVVGNETCIALDFIPIISS